MKVYLFSSLAVSLLGIGAVSTGATGNHIEQRASGDAQRGATVFKNECGLCHQGADGDGEGGAGPDLRGVVGRRIGRDKGFPYSEALAQSDEIWTAERLDAFLAEPASAFPGNVMPTNVPSASDRQDLVAYLAGLTEPTVQP